MFHRYPYGVWSGVERPPTPSVIYTHPRGARGPPTPFQEVLQDGYVYRWQRGSDTIEGKGEPTAVPETLPIWLLVGTWCRGTRILPTHTMSYLTGLDMVYGWVSLYPVSHISLPLQYTPCR